MDALSPRPLQVRSLGRRPYEPVWRAMQRFTDARGEDTVDELWLVEHEPVFTLGQAGKPEHVLAPGDIPVLHVDRGGQVTYHGPGQIVLYPLLDLRRSTIPSASSSLRRRDRSVGDASGMPRLSWEKRVAPATRSRRMRAVQRSQNSSAALAIGQNWP